MHSYCIIPSKASSKSFGCIFRACLRLMAARRCPHHARAKHGERWASSGAGGWCRPGIRPSSKTLPARQECSLRSCKASRLAGHRPQVALRHQRARMWSSGLACSHTVVQWASSRLKLAGVRHQCHRAWRSPLRGRSGSPLPAHAARSGGRRSGRTDAWISLIAAAGELLDLTAQLDERVSPGRPPAFGRASICPRRAGPPAPRGCCTAWPLCRPWPPASVRTARAQQLTDRLAHAAAAWLRQRRSSSLAQHQPFGGSTSWRRQATRPALHLQRLPTTCSSTSTD